MWCLYDRVSFWGLSVVLVLAKPCHTIKTAFTVWLFIGLIEFQEKLLFMIRLFTVAYFCITRLLGASLEIGSQQKLNSSCYVRRGDFWLPGISDPAVLFFLKIILMGF
jgi:hypothetical protein